MQRYCDTNRPAIRFVFGGMVTWCGLRRKKYSSENSDKLGRYRRITRCKHECWNQYPVKWSSPDELLSCEENHETLDFRGAPETVRIDPPLETVEPVHRGKNTRRKRALKNECA